MPTLTWPDALPPLIGQIGSLGTSALYAPPAETQFDDGPSRNRRRRLYDETVRTITLSLTRAQFVQFCAFVRGDLNMGARRFQARVRLPDGSQGLRTCRISGPIAEQDHGAVSVVAFALVVQDW